MSLVWFFAAMDTPARLWQWLVAEDGINGEKTNKYGGFPRLIVWID
ncbi:MAG: hypothetical protein L6Q53_06150 [Candidatus Brocadia sinica]|nr:hypothetical protein [Candidatus Brocadia sinica]NUO05087.1 hypothetical protein [Candidatus Brocadia sinica]